LATPDSNKVCLPKDFIHNPFTGGIHRIPGMSKTKPENQIDDPAPQLEENPLHASGTS